MKLLTVARRFDGLTCADAYNPATTFKGQFNLYDDSTRDGMTVERRVLSVAPTVSMPARKTLLADGLTWLVGDHHRDYFKNSAIRHRYVAHQATELVASKTFDEAITASAGYSAWASRIWVKGAKEIESSSDIASVYDIYFAPGEPIVEGTLVFMVSRWHLVRAIYPSTAGLLVALCDELPEPVRVTATFDKKVYAPLTDTFTTTPTAVTGIRVRWQSHFRYPISGLFKFQPGDLVLMVRKADIASPVIGDKVTISGDSYIIAAALDEGLCWNLHLTNV